MQWTRTFVRSESTGVWHEVARTDGRGTSVVSACGLALVSDRKCVRAVRYDCATTWPHGRGKWCRRCKAAAGRSA